MANLALLHEIELPDGRSVPLLLRRSNRARRYSLTLDPSDGSIWLTLPQSASLGRALDFARRQGGWVAERLERLPPRVAFLPGAQIPYLGVPHVLRGAPTGLGPVRQEEGILWVTGRIEHWPRRVTDFLKNAARREISGRARAKAALFLPGQGRRLSRIFLRDTVTRWGSCSPAGDLSFSWRLILAPEAVLDYVVAHEVAHLVHLNHSRAFWALVARLTPEVEGPRAWLRREGATLLRFG